MCTVTFIARKNGYALGMNRDEKLSRIPGLPPSKHVLNGRTAIFPSEPGGGTWIGINDAGVTFALINWYSVASGVLHNASSRGEVTRSMLALNEPFAVDRQLEHLRLNNTNPFRLIGVFPRKDSVVEWRWDLNRLKRVDFSWETNIWISSGFDEHGAQRQRRETFLAARLNESDDDLQWLRKLHGSHVPTRSPYSVCMHRPDANTVSYTEISVRDSMARMAYSPSPLCGSLSLQPAFTRLTGR